MEILKRITQGFGLGKPVAASHWGKPSTLDRGELGEARLALDGHGRGGAMWENHGRIWTMPIGPRSTPGLVRLPLGEGMTPRIELNAEGRGIALWQEKASGSRQILGKVLGGGDVPAHLIYRTEGRVRHLQVAVDRRGNVLLVWLVEQEGKLEVMAQSFDARASMWDEAPTTLGIPTLPTAEPRFAVNQREHAMVLWDIADESFEGLVASHYWPSEGIWSDRPVPVVSHPTRHHQVAMDDCGNALALWIHAPYGQRCSLEASYYDAQAGDWSTPETLCQAHMVANPRLAMSGGGEALAAWGQSEGHGPSRLYSKTFRKGQWDSGLECLELGHGPVRDFAIDLGLDGQAGLLSIHRGAEGDWVSARLRRRVWSEPVSLTPPSRQTCVSPILRLCPQGASALWIQGEGREKVLHLAESR